MKCSESWLREWVDPGLTREELCNALTMAGIEVEELSSVEDSELAGLVSKSALKDYTIDVSITPNRGDCLSVRGLAREISAITKTSLKDHPISSIEPTIEDILPINVQAKAGCPHYIGRIIRDVKTDTQTPDWLKDRLICSGIKTISPVVDITNYVMLELGQPMHAFNLETIAKEINVRFSRNDEEITLLDGSKKKLDDETLVIADGEKPLAIAGLMGGIDSSITLTTKDILLESAFFSPAQVAKQRQYHGLTSESAYRFERGVDPTIQRIAIEYATKLILEIAGGKPGPVIEIISKEHLPSQKTISLPFDKIQQVLGMDIPNEETESIFKSLNFEFKREKDKWTVQAPSYRFDLTIPEDLIEEIARIYGYDKIPAHALHSELYVIKTEQEARDLHQLRQILRDLGYQEIISYSFVDKKLQTLLNPNEFQYELVNPITADMNVMRTSLLPGLINAMLFNKNRQQHRLRLFEIGTCFINRDKTLTQIPKVSGLITGLCFPEQWGVKSREVDFYDIKGDIECLLSQYVSLNDCTFKPASHPSLHPGQTAAIYYQDQQLGILGAIHPRLLQDLGTSSQLFAFELDLLNLPREASICFHEISKFPEIRRDIAILIKQTVPAKEIQDTIKSVAGDWLKDVFIFDVYQGKGIDPGLKSIALALILQHPTRTLVDDEVTELMNKVISTLKGQLGAELRS